MELEHDGRAILIDCGLFQGPRTLETLNREPFSFDARKIAAVVLTHAHIDHSGLLPKLVAEGFRGPVYATPRSEEHTSELQSLMRNSYAVFCLKKKKQ